jgi:hypothetical protein
LAFVPITSGDGADPRRDAGDPARCTEPERATLRDRRANDPAPNYAISLRIRKRIEEAFGWIKTVGGQRKSRFGGLDRVGWTFTFAAAAYNLVRLPKPMARPVDRKSSGLAKAFAGRWRIVEMDVWDKNFLDLLEPAHLVFEGEAGGEIAFGTLKGFLDVRYGGRDGAACSEFSWEGHDDNDLACGRGWVIVGTAGRLVGHSFHPPGRRLRLRLRTRMTSSTAC